MYRDFFKRFLDFLVSITVLVCIGWFLIIIWIWLSFANKGAGALFLQERPGKDGKVFKVIKFKSMTDEKDENGKPLPDNQRLTKIGRFIRSTSIDELPQLINVAKGEMSLIGPRPLLVRYLPYYTEREKLRHTVRPGITGLAQIHGRNLVSWDEKLEYDVYYAENLTFWLDIKILFMTLVKVIKREGAVADKTEHYLDNERKSD